MPGEAAIIAISPATAAGATEAERRQAADDGVDVQITVLKDRPAIGRAAAAQAVRVLRAAIDERGRARMIAATGTSQFELLAALAESREVDWARVELFHLDEYVGLPASHPASFRRFLQDRLVGPAGIGRFHGIDGEADPALVIDRLGRELAAAPIDLACVGVGENGHLAFNEPPADFETNEPFLVVALDEVSRQQQVGEGWFAELAAVPARAITMSVRAILRAEEILCLAPDARKAQAVAACFAGPITPMAPASILRQHPKTTVYLDTASAGLLPSGMRS